MKTSDFRSTCAIARTLDLLGDTWSLLILRDMLLHQKSTFKEFTESKEKIATNILAHRLAYLTECGLIAKFSLKGTKKSTIYIATQQGIAVLPLLIELYLFSIEALPEKDLNDSQLAIKSEIINDAGLFIENKRKKYIEFVTQFENGSIKILRENLSDE